jgi:hypothetical protein
MCKKDQSVGSNAPKTQAILDKLLLVGCARCAVILLLLLPSPLAKEEETAVARDLHSRSYLFCFNEQCGKCWLVLLLLLLECIMCFACSLLLVQAKPSHAMRCDAMRCDAMRCDAMRWDIEEMK